MPVSRDEMQEDLSKVRMRKNLYFWGGLGMLALGVVLVVTFFTRDEWPALAMAAVAFFWGAVLLFHARRTLQLARIIESRMGLEQGRGNEPPGDRADPDAYAAEGREEGERGK